MIASTSAKQMYFFVFLTFFLNTEPGMEGVLQSCCCFVLKEDDLYDSCKNKTQVRSLSESLILDHIKRKRRYLLKKGAAMLNQGETLALFYIIIDMQE